MTNAAELCALAGRCEKAIFPCPDDASAAEVVAIRSAICHLMTGRGYDAYSPDHVGSIDDAMTLVPEGWVFSVTDAARSCRANVWKPSPLRDAPPPHSKGATPALALCAAALRAHAAIATEAHRAETPKSGSVHEGAGPKDIAQDIGGPSQ